MFSEQELTCDGFLDGKLSIWQPRKGYRAATDPVFLAAAVPASAGQSVLELGCGVGVAAFCLGCRVDGLTVTGVEIQPDYVELALRNSVENGVSLQVVEANLERLPPEIQHTQYDHVIANPPYLLPGAGTSASDGGKETAFREATPLAQWIDIAVRRLKPKGILTIIHLAERLPDILAHLDDRMGDIEVKPISGRDGKVARRVILRARKGGRGAFRLYAPLAVHKGTEHDGDKDSSSIQAQAILRDAKSLPF